MKKNLIVLLICLAGMIVTAAGIDLGVNADPVGREPVKWKPGYNHWRNHPEYASLVIQKAEDHENGGNAVALIKKDLPENYTDLIPVLVRPISLTPGKTYQITFWVKSDANGIFRTSLWSRKLNETKDFYVGKQFNVSSEWRQYNWKLTYPTTESNAFAAPNDNQISFDVQLNNLQFFLFKDVLIEEL